MPNLKSLDISDAELLLLFQAGDKHAFEKIYDRYWAIMYRHARKMIQDDEEAKDIVQEVFAKLWIMSNNDPLQSRIPSIQSPLAAFLYASTRNRVLDHIKHSKVKVNYLESIKTLQENHTDLPDRLVREKDLANQIENEINKLPMKMRRVFELSRKEHKTHKEISEILNISDKTVKKQVSNALLILKGKLTTFLFFF